ncbi:MAG TPA: hypothetical protein DDY68_01780 [Porphyromonadaceae bacterium]|nr:hypothetical protein [Porphyromonadaceae bacterium]
MEEGKHIVAIDIGSSEIVGGILAISPDKKMTLLAVKRENSDCLVRRGLIRNLEDIREKIEGILSSLGKVIEKRNLKIQRMYVGVCGQSLHSVRKIVQKTFDTEQKMTEQILTDFSAGILTSDNFRPYIPFEVIPVEYRLNDSVEKRPVGIGCGKIVVENVVVVGRSIMKSNVENCLKKLSIGVSGFLISPLELAKVVLTQEEKELGCVLVDFGGSTTTIAIYKGGKLIHLVTIPFGGDNITLDLTSLHLLEGQAEEIKQKDAHAMFNKSNENRKIYINNGSSAERFVLQSDVDAIVSARTEEILENVLLQVEEMGGKENLPSGFILVGGASRLNGLGECLKEKSKMEVRNGSILIDFENKTPENMGDPSLFNLLSLLLGGKINCADPVEVPQEKPVDNFVENKPEHTSATVGIGKKILDGILNFGKNIVDDGKDNNF